MTPNEKLINRIARLTTEQLIEISIRLTLDFSAEAIIVCNRVERELSRRMTESDFLEHMQTVETLLDEAMAA